jgi:predicted GNAT family acetyltransferase
MKGATMAEDFTIEREQTATRSRYVIRLPDGSEAELTYRHLDPRTVVADHTGVPPAFRNEGLALKLVEQLIADARQDGFKIVPECSYVAAQFRRHPAWADLMA